MKYFGNIFQGQHTEVEEYRGPKLHLKLEAGFGNGFKSLPHGTGWESIRGLGELRLGSAWQR